MTKRKTRRSRCASDTCGRQFRHADPSAATCSPACRQRVCRKKRKAKQERERREKYQRIAAVVLKRTALAKAEQDAAERERHAAARQAEEERRRSQPQPKPAPVPDDRGPGFMLGGLWTSTAPKQTLTITTKAPYHPTPLYRRRR